MRRRSAMDDYEGTVAWLYQLEKIKGIELKLERVAEALTLLGDPQHRLRCFHVAGTNGKGSVVRFLESVLAASGHRVGAYTSPHLVELTERIRVCGEEIARARVVEWTHVVRDRAIDAGVPLTFFEVLTAVAFLELESAAVDFAVIEVGLGGRLDATNLVDPLVSVITSIGRDHTRFLGDTEAAIAAEKGGIIKPGRPVVLGRVGADAERALRRIAEERDAPVVQLGRDFEWTEDTGGVVFEGLGRTYQSLDIGLVGKHQRDNAAVAIAALVQAGSPELEEQALRRGLREARWPGRIEVRPGPPLTILDGAHNVEAMRALVEALPGLSDSPPHVLFAAMGDKEWPQMVEMLAPHCVSAVVTSLDLERAVDADVLAREVGRHLPVEVEADPVRAWRRVCDKATEHGAVLVTGSLFLVGKVHEITATGRSVPS